MWHETGYYSGQKGTYMGASEGETSRQYERLILMADISDLASRIGRQTLERGEKLDVMKAFEQALVETLEHEGRDKNDLTALWAMFLLGSEAIKKLCRETDSY